MLKPRFRINSVNFIFVQITREPANSRRFFPPVFHSQSYDYLRDNEIVTITTVALVVNGTSGEYSNYK